MIDRPKTKPIVFKNGKKVDMSVASDQWVDDGVLEKGMYYIAKMSEGLATGTMTGDSDYVKLKNKIIKDLVRNTASSVTKKLCSSAQKRGNIYTHAERVQKEAVKKMNEYTKQTAIDGSKAFVVAAVKRSGGASPEIVRCDKINNFESFKWRMIDMEVLGKEIEEKQRELREIKKKAKQEGEDERILEEISNLVNESIEKDKSSKKKKKPAKKTMKKVSKKRKTKKNDRK